MSLSGGQKQEWLLLQSMQKLKIAFDEPRLGMDYKNMIKFQS